jgi:hypothetical protein
MAKHKNNYLRSLANLCNKTTAAEILKLGGKTKIELIEEIPNYNNKQELYNREKYYIDLNKNIVVNKNLKSL